MLCLRLATIALGGALLARAVESKAQSREIFNYARPSDQLAFDLQLFEPSTSPNSITTVDLATVPNHLAFTAGLWTNYASQLLMVQSTVGGVPTGPSRPIVDHIWQTELHASLGLFNYFELGVAIPLVETGHVGLVGANPATQTLDTSQTAQQQQSLRVGDIRGYIKIPIPYLPRAWPVAVRLGASFPAGGDDAFAGNIAWTFSPELVASHAFGRLTAAVNLGYRLRQRNGLAGDVSFVLDDEFIWSVGARYALTPRVAVNAEVVGRVGVSYGSPQANRTPIEGLLGGLYQVSDSFAVQAGVGRGFTSGYGSPEIRGYVGARFTASGTRCTTGPEDYDGFQDGDYCGDPDNDQDGILDADDLCPNDPEDRDGYLDQDGCPDTDNDADEVVDPNDRCPMDPEDHDGFEDADGCPDPDNDGDGIPDAQDLCPMDPEDIDNYEDQDGCPEGGAAAVVVTRTESHLLLSQRVFFDYDSDTIRSVSLPILSEVARTLRANPDITRVRIEGYTDGHGDPQYNLDLSFRRARAVVEYLVTQGISHEHLDFQGYGSTHPIADDSTPEGQALNRRVDFTIVNQQGRSSGQHAPATNTAPPSPTPAPSAAPARHRHHHHEP